MSKRQAYRLTQDIVLNDGTPVLLAGAYVATSEEGTRALFNTALLLRDLGPPLFEVAFLAKIAGKLEPVSLSELPDGLLELEPNGIPGRGWGMS